MKIISTLLFYLISMTIVRSEITCERIGPATCQMSDGSGMVNLSALGRTSDLFRFLVQDDNMYLSYLFNPGVGVNVAGYQDLAVLQWDGGDLRNPLGYQSTEDFEYSEDDGRLILTYKAEDGKGVTRTSRILLRCEFTGNQHAFEVSDIQSEIYYFELRGPCACRNMCDGQGIIAGHTLPPDVETSAPIRTACTRMTFGKCNMVDGSGVINLSSLKSTNITSNFVSCTGDYCYPSCTPEILEANIIMCTMMGTMEYFTFTPVTAFTWKDLDGLAVLKYGIKDIYPTFDPSSPVTYEDIGIQMNEEFVLDDLHGLVLKYTSEDKSRTSSIRLICQPFGNADIHEFTYVSQPRVNDYYFELKGLCACPDGCSDTGPKHVNECAMDLDNCDVNADCINSVDSFQCKCKEGFVGDGTHCSLDVPDNTPLCERNSLCRCNMTDGSGEINLESLSSSSGSAKWNTTEGDWTYQYNPCIGFTATESTTMNNLAILQSRSSEYGPEEYDLGFQPYSVFINDSNGNIQLHYNSADAKRQSTVDLICNQDIPDHLFQYIGEPQEKIYEFTLTGPCACPGICDKDGVKSAALSVKRAEDIKFMIVISVILQIVAW